MMVLQLFLLARRKIYWLLLLACLLLLHSQNPRRSYEEKWPIRVDYDQSQLQHTHPVDILDRCLSVRVRNVPETLSLEDGIRYLQEHYPDDLKMGMTIYEDNNDFWGLAGHGKLHLFHYLEFLVYGYASFVRIAGNSSSLSQANLQIPWVHAPYLSRSELRGSRDTNQLFTDLALRQSNILRSTTMRGMEDNDDVTQGLHPSFQGAQPKSQPDPWREWVRRRVIPSKRIRKQNWQEMTDQVDAVLFIHRHKCDTKHTGQMHAKLSDPGMFPAEAWSQDIRKGLGITEEHKRRFVACYIDRQNSGRTMPDKEHDWLVDHLKHHAKVDFKQLKMEQYSGLQQIQLASKCDMILGVHGNGLSHELWMPPGSHVVEYYWQGDYVYCYSILAKMMHHSYIGFWRGKQIPPELVAHLDPTLNQKLDHTAPIEAEESRRVFSEFLNRAVAQLEAKRSVAQIDP